MNDGMLKNQEKGSSQKSTSQEQNITEQDIIGAKGCLIGCWSFIIIFLLLIVIVSCSDNSGGSTNYKPGDFDFDGDSGDLDDANEFLKWKINEERKNGD